MLISLLHAIEFPSWISSDIISFGENGRFALRWYGVSYIVGLVGAYYYAVRMTKRRDIWVSEKPTRSPEIVPTESILSDLMFYCLIGIILGGRLGYITLYSPETFLKPAEVLKVWEGGMSFHGGFLGVVAACAFASWKFKVDKFRIGDMASIGAPIGLGMVRLFGNFFNQELWGRETDVAWGMIFPKDPDLLVRHPSQLYEAFLEGFVLFITLLIMVWVFKALKKPGLVAGVFVMGYGLSRIAVEFVREPDAHIGYLVGNWMTMGMVLSTPIVLIGLWSTVRALKNAKQ